MADNNNNKAISRSGAAPIRSMCRRCCGAWPSSICPMSASTPAWTSARTTSADYLAMNPNGRVPDAGRRRLCAVGIQFHHALSLPRLWQAFADLSAGRKRRAQRVDRWLDWTLSTLQPVDRPVFWALVRTPPGSATWSQIQRDADAEAVVWSVVEAQLANRRFIEGDQFTLADIAIGAYARRWLGVEGVTKPKLPNPERWFKQISDTSGTYKIHRAADDVRQLLSASRRTRPRRRSPRRRSSCRYWCLRF